VHKQLGKKQQQKQARQRKQKHRAIRVFLHIYLSAAKQQKLAAQLQLQKSRAVQ
jgi:hypothetical protein